MPDPRLARWRLAAQMITRPGADPAAVVRHLGAVQAQDYRAALWAIGLRTAGATEAAVERALADRTIVRAHFMRNTVHIVPAEDLRWMLRLVAPRIRMLIDNIARANRLDVDFERGNDLVAAALAGGKQLTRAELAVELEAAGVRTGEGRMMLMAQRAQTDGVVCQAVRTGAHAPLALAEDWLPAGRDLDGEEAEAELARRYVRGHGPATERDYAWWSGLTLTAARRGLAAASDLRRAGDHWSGAPEPAEAPAGTHLLPNYDEFLVAYKDRSAAVDPADGNVIFVHTVVADGVVVARWKRTGGRLAVTPFRPFDRASLTAAAERYAAFLGRPVEV